MFELVEHSLGNAQVYRRLETFQRRKISAIVLTLHAYRDLEHKLFDTCGYTVEYDTTIDCSPHTPCSGCSRCTCHRDLLQCLVLQGLRPPEDDKHSHLLMSQILRSYENFVRCALHHGLTYTLIGSLIDMATESA